MSEDTKAPRPLLVRLWPLYVIAGGLGAAWFFGLFEYLTPEGLSAQQKALTGFVSDNFMLAVITYVVVYAIATLIMMPGALWITIAGGLMFGLIGGTIVTVIGATIGASLLFFAAKSSLGSRLRKLAGSYAEKASEEFNSSPLSYMFAMRFVPAMPFPIANIVPAILGAKYRDYLVSTAIGIIPGAAAYTFVGTTLEKAASEQTSPGDMFWMFLPVALVLLALSILPIAYKKFFAKKPAEIEGTA